MLNAIKKKKREKKRCEDTEIKGNTKESGVEVNKKPRIYHTKVFRRCVSYSSPINSYIARNARHENKKEKSVSTDDIFSTSHSPQKIFWWIFLHFSPFDHLVRSLFDSHLLRRTTWSSYVRNGLEFNKETKIHLI